MFVFTTKFWNVRAISSDDHVSTVCRHYTRCGYRDSDIFSLQSIVVLRYVIVSLSSSVVFPGNFPLSRRLSYRFESISPPTPLFSIMFTSLSSARSTNYSARDIWIDESHPQQTNGHTHVGTENYIPPLHNITYARPLPHLSHQNEIYFLRGN